MLSQATEERLKQARVQRRCEITSQGICTAPARLSDRGRLEEDLKQALGLMDESAAID